MARSTHGNSLDVVPTKQYIVFVLGQEKYALDISTVQEIKGSVDEVVIAKVSDMPPHIIGMTQLRNQVTPVIDLRIFYHIVQDHEATCPAIIFLNIENTYYGIIVDAVLDLAEFSGEHIKPAPEFMMLNHHNHVLGVSQHLDSLIILLDIVSLIYSDELQVAHHLVKESL